MKNHKVTLIVGIILAILFGISIFTIVVIYSDSKDDSMPELDESIVNYNLIEKLEV